MTKSSILAVLVLGAPHAAQAQAVQVPSGLDVEIREVLVDTVEAETWVRFRFLAPDISRDREDAPDFFALSQDFQHLCEEQALPYLDVYDLAADKIAISLSDRPVDFGTTDPQATQYFEVFRLEDASCVWDDF